jgi:hypothetical protein
VPIGYGASAFALGVAAGTVVRRTVPAIAITLAVYVLVLVAVPTVRAHLAPATLTTRITQENVRGLSASFDVTGKPNGPVKDLTVAVDKPGAWIVANETLDPSGAVADELPSWMSGCLPAPPAPGEGGPGPTRRPAGADGIGACLERLTASGYRQRVSYEPAGRFWTLHAIETAFLSASRRC